jgi:hypothetical protein
MGAGDDDSPATAALQAKAKSAASEELEEVSAAGSTTKLEGGE